MNTTRVTNLTSTRDVKEYNAPAFSDALTLCAQALASVKDAPRLTSVEAKLEHAKHGFTVKIITVCYPEGEQGL